MLGMMLAGVVTAGVVTFVVPVQEADARTDQAVLSRQQLLSHVWGYDFEQARPTWWMCTCVSCG